MKKKVNPILICRTKYVDYNDPVFCAPKDISPSITKALHDVIIKGNNLRHAEECKVFISDDQHVVIGKVLYIRELGEHFDVSLDKETNGRSAWGFIGGVLSREEYVAEQKILDLPREYYVQAYQNCLYDQHWKEEVFKGPYPYGAFDIKMEILPKLETSLSISDEVPIFSSSKNDDLFRYVAEQTLKGKSVAFCSNEEFNASEAILKGALTYATVSEGNLHIQIESYKSAIAAKPKKARVNANAAGSRECVENRNYYDDFSQKLDRLCEEYKYERIPISEEGDVRGFLIIPKGTDISKSDNIISKACKKIKKKLPRYFKK